MNPSQPGYSSVRPLISEEQMREILAARKPISTEECYRQIEQHLGRPMRPAYRKKIVDGREVWVPA
jgi:hypothetical protein